jgi:hypothetical protein
MAWFPPQRQSLYRGRARLRRRAQVEPRFRQYSDLGLATVITAFWSLRDLALSQPRSFGNATVQWAPGAFRSWCGRGEQDR